MSRVLDFSDGFESSASPTQGNVESNSLKVFVDDAAYVTDKGSAATEGDIYENSTSNFVRYYNGTDWIDLVTPAGTQTLTNKSIDGSLNTITNVHSEIDSFDVRENLGIAASVAASALTLEVKQSDGSTDATSGSPVRLPMRSTTLAGGSYSTQSFTAAESVVIPSGATLGHASGLNEDIYYYAIYDGTNFESGVSASWYPEGKLYNTTALSAAADSKGVIYSTTARTNVVVKFLCKATSNQTVAGTWDAAPIVLNMYPFAKDFVSASVKDSSADTYASGSDIDMVLQTVAHDTHNAYSTGTGEFTCPFDGFYRGGGGLVFQSNAGWNPDEYLRIGIKKEGTIERYFGHETGREAAGSPEMGSFGWSPYIYCNAGDKLKIFVRHNGGFTATAVADDAFVWVAFERR